MPASLARRHDEPVEVERRDDEPVAFVRRGRRYTVRAVLGHWWETRAWWEGGAGREGWELSAGVCDDERELWRVEASTRAGSVAVVDLSFAWTTGCWAVDAVLD